jgi:N-sulfoglucosamine sulfohydrolase
MQRTRFHFILIQIVFTVAFSASPQNVYADPDSDPPNILLIVSEDNGPDLGCYGNPYVSTPHLDHLAIDGVLFDNAFVPLAGCSQSRAAFLTGLYPHQNGQFGLATWKFHMYDPDTPNLVASLHNAGYRTGLLGKLHVNPESAFPFDMRWGNSNFSRRDLEQYAERAESFISESDDPFFLSVNYPDAHRPFLREANSLPEDPLTQEDVLVPEAIGIETEGLLRDTADYYNCMSRLDALVGDLLDALDRSGKRDNTWIIYFGDHGFDILRGKRTSLEQGLRIPLIIASPNGARGTVRDELVSTIDLAPTLLAAAGIEAEVSLPGLSLDPLLQDETMPEWREYLFTEFVTHSAHNYFPQRTVRDSRFKLIETLMPGEINPGYDFTLNKFYDPESVEAAISNSPPVIRNAYERMQRPLRWQLFDLENDPHEWIDLSEDPAHAETLARLQVELLRWRQETEDPFLDPGFVLQVRDEIESHRRGEEGYAKPDRWEFYDALPTRVRGVSNRRIETDSSPSSDRLNIFNADATVNGHADWKDRTNIYGRVGINILFIAADDLRCNIGCMDDPIARTPNIDRLASQGTLFERAYIQVSICNASRASMLTGLRSDTIGVWDLNTHFRDYRSDVVTIPQLFRENGYRSVNLGKIHHGTGRCAVDPPSWSDPQEMHLSNRSLRYALPKNDLDDKKADAAECADVNDDAYFEGILANRAVERLEEFAESGEPFFLGLGFKCPHLPFSAPKRYWDLYERDQFEDDVWEEFFGPNALPSDAPSIAGHAWPELRGYRDIPDEGDLSPEKRAELRHGYYASTSYHDACLGQVLDALERTGLTENTIIVYWSDHGFELGDHGLWGKLTNYETATRVPLIIAAPDFPHDQQTLALVEAIDIYPTLAELAGLNPPSDLEGRSMVPLLCEPDLEWKTAAMSQFHRPVDYSLKPDDLRTMGYTIRTARYRYVEWHNCRTHGIEARELYDHETDPVESINLANHPEHAKRIAELERMLAALRIGENSSAFQDE